MSGLELEQVTRRAGPPARRAPSRRDRPRAAAPPRARLASRAPARRAPSARAAGRTRARGLARPSCPISRAAEPTRPRCLEHLGPAGLVACTRAHPVTLRPLRLQEGSSAAGPCGRRSSWPTASCRCSCSSLISTMSCSRQLREHARGLVAHLLEQLVRARRSRARSAPGGRPRRRRSCASVATMIRTPSSDRWRRSRSATSWTSPTPRPSTNVTPAVDLADDPGAVRRRARRPSRSRRARSPPPARPPRAPARRAPRASGTRRARASPPWPDEREHRPQLLRVAVAGDVNRRVLLVQHLGADLCEPVDRVVDAQLVPGDGLARR